MIKNLKTEPMSRCSVSTGEGSSQGKKPAGSTVRRTGQDVCEYLNKEFPLQVIEPRGVEEIPANTALVYVLCRDDQAIVVGEGKQNRAKVIFDDKTRCTKSHIKSLMVRAHHLCAGPGVRFRRFVVRCADKVEARHREKALHRLFGGNSCRLPADAEKKIFSGLRPDSPAWLVLRMACASSFSGLADLHGWRRKGIVNDEVWAEITNRLQLQNLKPHRNSGRR